MTSLSTQLASLSSKLSGHVNFKKKTHKSFMYPSNLDTETLYHYAENGLYELIQMNASFEPLLTTLFCKSKVMNFHRSERTAMELTALDIQLRDCLLLLSPYFLLKAAHKVLEFLIRVYEITQFNVTPLMQAFLCYHESPVFVKLIQLCTFENNSHWSFLNSVKSSNAPITKHALASQCLKNLGLLRFLTDAIDVLGEAQAGKMITCFTVTVLEMIERERNTLPEALLRVLLPRILSGLKSSIADTQMASYMLLCATLVKATLSPTVQTTLMVTCAKHMSRGHEADTLLCLIYLCQTQGVSVFPPTALQHVVSHCGTPESFATRLQAVLTQTNGTVALDLILTACLEEVTTYHATLKALWTHVTVLNASHMDTLVTSLLPHVVVSEEENLHRTSCVSALFQHLQTLGSVAPLLTEALDRFFAGLSVLHQARMTSFCASTFSPTSGLTVRYALYKDGTTLFCALEHPSVSTRVEALVALASQLKQGQSSDAFFGPVLLRRISDDSSKVLQALCRNPILTSSLLKTVAMDTLVLAIAHAMKSWTSEVKHARSSLTSLLTLAHVVVSHASGLDSVCTQHLLQAVVPHVYPPTKVSSLALSVASQLKGTVLEFCQDETSLVQTLSDNTCLQLTRFLPVVSSWIIDTPRLNVALGLAVLQYLVTYLQAQETLAATEAKKDDDERLPCPVLAVVTPIFFTAVESEWQRCVVDASCHDNTEALALATLLVTLVPLVSTCESTRLCQFLWSAPSSLFATLQPQLTTLVEAQTQTLAYPHVMSTLCHLMSNDVSVVPAMMLTRLVLLWQSLYQQRTLLPVTTENATLTDRLVTDFFPRHLTLLHHSVASVRQVALNLVPVLATTLIPTPTPATPISSKKKKKSKRASLSMAPITTLQSFYLAMGAYVQDIALDAAVFQSRCLITLTQPDQSYALSLIHSAITSTSSLALLHLCAPLESLSFWHQIASCEAVFATQGAAEVVMAGLLRVPTTPMTTGDIPDTVAQSINDLLTPASSSTRTVLQRFIVSQLSNAWYHGCTESRQHVLLQTLVRLMATTVDSDLSDALTSCCHATLEVSVSALQSLLVCCAMDNDQCPRWTLVVLELVVFNLTAHPVIGAGLLLAPLASRLSALVNRSDVNTDDYVIGLLLTAMLKVTARMGSSSDSAPMSLKQLPECLDAILICCNASPQIASSAFLLYGALCPLNPTVVLSKLSQVLFQLSASSGSASTTLLSRSDDFSFYVISNLITKVVPQLVLCPDVFNPLDFIHSFIASFNVMSTKRRVPLFSLLATTLGVEDFLYAIIQCLVLENQSTFALTLCLSIGSVTTQINACVDLLEQVSGIVEQESTLSSTTAVPLLTFIQSFLTDPTFHLALVDHEDDTQAPLNELRDDMDEDDDMAVSTLEASYLELAEALLLLLQKNASNPPSASQTTLAALGLDILSSLEALLSTASFVAVMSELLHHEEPSLRKRACMMLNRRLTTHTRPLTGVASAASVLSLGEELLFLDLLEDLQDVLANPSEGPSTLQTACLSVDMLARTFNLGSKKKQSSHGPAFQQIFPTLVALIMTHSSDHVTGSGFVCFSTLCQCLPAFAVQFLPKGFPKLLECLDATTNAELLAAIEVSDPTVETTLHDLTVMQQCLLSSMLVLVQSHGGMLNPFLSRMMSLLMALDGKPDVATLVSALRTSLTASVEIRLLLPALFSTFNAHATDVSTHPSLCSMLSSILTRLEPKMMAQHVAPLVQFFLTAFDTVSATVTYDGTVLEIMLETFMIFVLKLNEKQLKPIFIKLVEWSVVPSASPVRKITLYRLMGKMTRKLKSIFVPYFSHVLTEMVSILTTGSTSRETSTNVQLTDTTPCSDVESDKTDVEESFFIDAHVSPPSSKKAKLNHVVSSPSSQQQTLSLPLVRSVLFSLNECFKYDKNGFMNADRFELLVEPIVEQLGTADRVTSQHADNERFLLDDSVIGCISNLAWCVRGNDALWKPLHHHMLMKSRSDDPIVRLASLKGIEKCYQVVGEEFLVMLPESIPFLSELMEDDAPEVVTLCHKVIKHIESLSGESLNDYLVN